MAIKIEGDINYTAVPHLYCESRFLYFTVPHSLSQHHGSLDCAGSLIMSIKSGYSSFVCSDASMYSFGSAFHRG